MSSISVIQGLAIDIPLWMKWRVFPMYILFVNTRFAPLAHQIQDRPQALSLLRK